MLHHKPTDYNWMVVEASRARKKLREIRLTGVTDLEQRVLIKVAIRALDHREVMAALKSNSNPH